MSASSTYVTNEYSVEVNLVGTTLDPERITSILDMQPIKAARAGEARHKDRDDALYHEGFWSYESSSRDDITECRDHQLTYLVDSIEPNVEQLREAGVERIYFYYTLSSFFGMMNIRFKAETMEKLSRLGADLYISCFDCFNPNHSFWKDSAVDGVEEHADSQSTDH